MPSTLGSNIIDILVPTLDTIRSAVHGAIGDRQYRVYLCTRTWSGSQRAQGTPTIVATEIVPAPAVEFKNGPHGVSYNLQPQGKSDDGFIELKEVSLAYSEDQLCPKALAPNVEYYYRIVDGQGQNIRTRYGVPDGPPAPDREKDIGWSIRLRVKQVVE